MSSNVIEILLSELINDRRKLELELQMLVNKQISVTDKIINIKKVLAEMSVINSSIGLLTAYMPINNESNDDTNNT